MMTPSGYDFSSGENPLFLNTNHITSVPNEKLESEQGGCDSAFRLFTDTLEDERVRWTITGLCALLLTFPILGMVWVVQDQNRHFPHFTPNCSNVAMIFHIIAVLSLSFIGLCSLHSLLVKSNRSRRALYEHIEGQGIGEYDKQSPTGNIPCSCSSPDVISVIRLVTLGLGVELLIIHILMQVAMVAADPTYRQAECKAFFLTFWLPAGLLCMILLFAVFKGVPALLFYIKFHLFLQRFRQYDHTDTDLVVFESSEDLVIIPNNKN